MRFSVVAILLGATAASASLFARQDAGFPACGQSCLVNAQLGSCQLTDTKCLCTNQDFVTSTTQCIQSSCTGADLQAALQAAQGLCLQAGVTLTSTPAAASSTGAASGSGSSTGAAASSTPTSPSGSGSSAAAGSSTASTPAGSASAGSSASSSAPASASGAASGAMTHGVSAVAGLAALAAAFVL